MSFARFVLLASVPALGFAAKADVPLVAKTFAEVPGQNCPAAAGEAFIVQRGSTPRDHAMTIKMNGMPNGCSGVLPGLRCKVAVFTGTSCEAAARGAVLANANQKYVTSFAGTAVDQNKKLGFQVAPLSDLVGKPLGIHDKDGNVCACAKLERVQLASAVLQAALPDGSGASGTIIAQSGGSGAAQHHVLFLDLARAPTQCASATHADPKCGVFVSSATSCSAANSAKLVKEHRAFANLRYYPTSAGKVVASTRPSVTGKPLDSLIGKAVVIVDQAGVIAGCALLSKKSTNGGNGNQGGNGGGSNLNMGSRAWEPCATAMAAMALTAQLLLAFQ